MSQPFHTSFVSSKIKVVPVEVLVSTGFVLYFTGILSTSEPGVNAVQSKVAFSSSLFPFSVSATDFIISFFDNLLHANRPIPFSPAFFLLYFLEIGFSSLSIVAILIQVFLKVGNVIPEPLSSTVIIPPICLIFSRRTVTHVASAS